MAFEFERKQRITIVGGGPGGYEAALAGAQLGADVTARRSSPTWCRRRR
jgi:dihydrolipoamide dehydrogenase